MARLLYDLTGLLHWYAYFGRPAGVQRVIEQVGASAVLQEAARSSTSQARTVEVRGAHPRAAINVSPWTTRCCRC